MPCCRRVVFEVVFVCPCGSVVASTAYAEYASLRARRDNTLHQDPTRSNGQGNILVGRTGQDGSVAETVVSIRRGLIQLDIAGSVHPGGANLAYVDGSIRFAGEQMEQAVLEALCTRSGGEIPDGTW